MDGQGVGEQAVLAQVLAVIACHDDYRIVEEPAPFEVLYQFVEPCISGRNRGVVEIRELVIIVRLHPSGECNQLVNGVTAETLGEERSDQGSHRALHEARAGPRGGCVRQVGFHVVHEHKERPPGCGSQVAVEPSVRHAILKPPALVG